MFGIKVGNEFLDLEPKNSISFQFNSSFFDAGSFNGNFSFPFNPAYSPKNIRLFGHRMFPQVIGNIDDQVDGILYIGGLPYKKCKINLTSASKKISAFLQVDNSFFADKLKDTKLKDVPMGGDRYIGNTVADKIAHFNASAPADARLQFDYIFFPTYNPLFYKSDDDVVLPEFLSNAGGVLNYFYLGTFVGNNDANDASGASRLTYSYVPYPSLLYVIKKVCEFLSLDYYGEVFDNPYWQRAVIYNTVAIDRLFTNGFGITTNVYQNNINLQNHVPDVTIEEFLGALRTDFFLDHFINTDTGRIEFRFMKSILRDPYYEDWSQNTNPDIEEEVIDQSGFKFLLSRDSDDETFEELQYTDEIIEGKGEQEINMNIAKVFDAKDYNDELVFNRKDPYAKQVGNSLEDTLNSDPTSDNYLWENKFSFRIMFYHGRQPDSLGNLVPFGSSDIYNYNESLVGSLSMNWFGTYGRREQLAKDYIEFFNNTKKLIIKKRMTESELQSFNPQKKYMFYGIKVLIQQIKFSSDLNKKDAIITAYKL